MNNFSKLLNKIIIWDLFGGSQNSVWNAIKYFKNIEIYTFDICEIKQHNNHYVVDLTDLKAFKELIEKNNIPYPHIICASPICTPFSYILHINGNETLAYKYDKDNKYYKSRSLEEIEQCKTKNGFYKNFDANKIFETGLLGLACLNSAINIIEEYKPFAWYIENPHNSLMWNVINSNGYRVLYESLKSVYHNVADYNSYDLSFTQKRTIFLSNHPLDLHSYGITGNINKPKSSVRSNVYFGGNGININGKEQNKNVKIPELLILDIINQFSIFMYYNGKDKWKKKNHLEILNNWR